jgi:ferredoxin
MKRSTRDFWREGQRTPGFSFLDWLHGYVYGRWPYLYIGIGTGEHWIPRRLGRVPAWLGRLVSWVWGEGDGASWADGYHGKVVPLETATQLVTIQEDIDLGDLEQVIPYTQARDLILHHPDHLVALECPCRAARPDPCLPLDVCLIVGEPFASFVHEHHPRRSRWLTPDEAVAILKAEDERGHAHHAFFKDAMLGRFFAICNCCTCCCGAMHAHRNGTPMLASSGYLAHVDEAHCVGCGACEDVCPFGALGVVDGRARVDAAVCMGCGVCVGHCPEGALALLRDPVKGEPLEIQKSIAQAAQVQYQVLYNEHGCGYNVITKREP